MTTVEQLKQEIGNRLFELWILLPEPKKTYTHYYQQIDAAIDNWHPPKTEKRIADRERGDVGV